MSMTCLVKASTLSEIYSVGYASTAPVRVALGACRSSSPRSNHPRFAVVTLFCGVVFAFARKRIATRLSTGVQSTFDITTAGVVDVGVDE